jgi:signal transduction histidine kinase
VSAGRDRLAYVAAIAWMIATISLASWWLFFGLAQAGRLAASGSEAAELAQVRRMLVWEGVVFLGLLGAGGVVLVVAIRREASRRRAVEEFFMAFTHDLKTSLTSLQLQAESLEEELPAGVGRAAFERLRKDMLRLQLQLENSLYLAQPDGRLLAERVTVRPLVERAAADWPELSTNVDGDARVLADERALAGVVRNVLQNAVIHGGATAVSVRVVPAPARRVRITIEDNGRGASPESVDRLGQEFPQPAAGGGSGVGLFVSRQLLKRMQGTLAFGTRPGRGFAAIVELPEAP